MSNFISDRVSEGSTHQGVIVAAAACAVLFGGMGLTQVILYGALAWGVWSMLKKVNYGRVGNGGQTSQKRGARPSKNS